MPESGKVRPPGSASAAVAECDTALLRTELERILGSAPFRNSRRYSSFLRYVVERTLDGQAAQLKERAIGTDVFDRQPDYDTNIDHVVRSAAGEVRRRLAQYYQEEGADSDIRVELRPGSYVPQFHPVARTDATRAGDAPIPEADDPPAARRRYGWALALALGLATLALFAVRFTPAKVLDRFWEAAVPDASVIFCVGDDSAPAGKRFATPQRLFAEDAVALARLSYAAAARGKGVTIRTQRSTTFNDLKESPAVLIGAFNNDWTIRTLAPLRFRFEPRPDLPAGGAIIDAQNPSKFWTPEGDFPPGGDLSQGYIVTKDYAIVAKLRDSQTDKPVVIAAGVLGYGTVAAAEFLTNADYLAALDAEVPKGWEQKNFAVVLSTEVFRGNAGPPRIVARHFW